MRWDEKKHPRKSDGKFSNGSSSLTKEKTVSAIQKYSTTPDEDIAKMGLTNGTKSDTIKLVKSQPRDFANRILEAKKSNPNGWAVDAHSVEDYKKDKLFTTPDGLSGIAVEPSGNIVSVFKHQNSTVRGAAKYLLGEAVKNGGDRLDAYGEDLYDIYTKNGFEPVSWINWNAEYAPLDWKESDGRQDIVFYRYTNSTTQKQSYEEFQQSVTPSSDYDTAARLRDKCIRR